MFELPECTVLAAQMNEKLYGKVISSGRHGNSPHKFVWYNCTPEQFSRAVGNKIVRKATVKGRWLFLGLDPGYVLVLGECGGRMLYHKPGSRLPAKYHLLLEFNDGSFFTVTTQMWGAMELYEKGNEYSGKYVKDMRPTPLEKDFHFRYFNELIDEASKESNRSTKGLLTQEQLIPGLGNACVQDILFRAKLNPRHPISLLTESEKRNLYDAILETVQEIIRKGGRYDEFNLFNKPGGYIRILDKNAVDRPCPLCGTPVEKFRYLGGTCYVCPNCQKMSHNSNSGNAIA